MKAKSKDYTIRLRMGATNYDLTVLLPNETINYDMSRMGKKARKALRNSVVSAFRQSLEVKVIDHA